MWVSGFAHVYYNVLYRIRVEDEYTYVTSHDATVGGPVNEEVC